MTLLSRFTSWSNEPALPPITDAETRAFGDAMSRREPRPISEGEPRREPVARVYGESFDVWLRRTAAHQPSHGDAE